MRGRPASSAHLVLQVAINDNRLYKEGRVGCSAEAGIGCILECRRCVHILTEHARAYKLTDLINRNIITSLGKGASVVGLLISLLSLKVSFPRAKHVKIRPLPLLLATPCKSRPAFKLDIKAGLANSGAGRRGPEIEVRPVGELRGPLSTWIFTLMKALSPPVSFAGEDTTKFTMV